MLLSSGALLNVLIFFVGPALLGLFVYYRGRKAGERDLRDEIDQEQRAVEAKLRAAEAKNAWIDKQREQKNEAIDSEFSVDNLIRLWNERESKKGPDSPTDKDPK